MNPALLEGVPFTIQAIGYSGGFAPMLEALNQASSDVEMVVGVGAATLDLTRFRDVLGLTVNLLRSLLSERVLTQNSPDWILDSMNALKEFNNSIKRVPVFGSFIGILESVIAGIFNSGKSLIDMMIEATEVVFDKFSTLMEELKVQALVNAQPLIGLTNLNDRAKGVINIYGDKDLVADLGVGGYRPSIAGFSGDNLINIEIKSQRGALSDHYTYMHKIRTPVDYAEMATDGNTYQHAFDDRVANFVARLLVVGKNPQDASSFLMDSTMLPFVQLTSTGVYEFYPFGIAEGIS